MGSAYPRSLKKETAAWLTPRGRFTSESFRASSMRRALRPEIRTPSRQCSACHHGPRGAIGHASTRPFPYSGNRSVGKRLAHATSLWGALVRVLVRCVLLVVHGLGVDRPDVVVGSLGDILHGAHRREHRVVRVVVAMQAVAADLDQVPDALEPVLDDVHAVGVV